MLYAFIYIVVVVAVIVVIVVVVVYNFRYKSFIIFIRTPHETITTPAVGWGEGVQSMAERFLIKAVKNIYKIITIESIRVL